MNFLQTRPARSMEKSADTYHVVLAELTRPRQPLQFAMYYLGGSSASRVESVKQLAQDGGPDLTDLRGYPNADRTVVIRKPLPNNSAAAHRLKKPLPGPYHRKFRQLLIDAGVIPYGCKCRDGSVVTKPSNWKEIIDKFAEPPPSSVSTPDCTEIDYARFARHEACAKKEKATEILLYQRLDMDDIEDADCRSGEIAFGDLRNLLKVDVVPGNPDLYYGSLPTFVNHRVCHDLYCDIVPSTEEDAPIAPNFFLAVKGLDGTLAVAIKQACYDGTLGARGIQSLRSYGLHTPVHDNNAYTITSIFHGGMLRIYTIHPTAPTSPKYETEYHMNQVGCFAMTHNWETFRAGVFAWRNAKQWAKQQRDEAIKLANERADQAQSNTRAAPTSVNDAALKQQTSSDTNRTVGPPLLEATTRGSNTTEHLTEDSSTRLSGAASLAVVISETPDKEASLVSERATTPPTSAPTKRRTKRPRPKADQTWRSDGVDEAEEPQKRRNVRKALKRRTRK